MDLVREGKAHGSLVVCVIERKMHEKGRLKETRDGINKTACKTRGRAQIYRFMPDSRNAVMARLVTTKTACRHTYTHTCRHLCTRCIHNVTYKQMYTHIEANTRPHPCTDICIHRRMHAHKQHMCNFIVTHVYNTYVCPHGKTDNHKHTQKCTPTQCPSSAY